SRPEGGCSWYVLTVVDLEIATEEEKSLLAAWKTYRVLLNRVDTSTAPDIEWPEEPDTM
ncbi:tail fiber assembly protein, partial [Escherichia coli]|uniref:tail fiber assembly protein n=1 Tax=Escherichia coli TaxID=562 RepID=UPI001C44A70F